jgi:hypothetical protein
MILTKTPPACSLKRWPNEVLRVSETPQPALASGEDAQVEPSSWPVNACLFAASSGAAFVSHLHDGPVCIVIWLCDALWIDSMMSIWTRRELFPDTILTKPAHLARERPLGVRAERPVRRPGAAAMGRSEKVRDEQARVVGLLRRDAHGLAVLARRELGLRVDGKDGRVVRLNVGEAGRLRVLL